jgi:hypothetical protein
MPPLEAGPYIIRLREAYTLQLLKAGRWDFMAKYGKKAGQTVKRVMEEQKRGTLRSGRSGRKVTSRKQAIAIGLSEARDAGAKVPPRPSGSRKPAGARKRAGTRKK